MAPGQQDFGAVGYLQLWPPGQIQARSLAQSVKSIQGQVITMGGIKMPKKKTRSISMRKVQPKRAQQPAVQQKAESTPEEGNAERIGYPTPAQLKEEASKLERLANDLRDLAAQMEHHRPKLDQVRIDGATKFGRGVKMLLDYLSNVEAGIITAKRKYF